MEANGRVCYDKATLLRLKPLNLTMNKSMYISISKSGLLKQSRGRRGGSHINRKISVIVTERKNSLQYRSPLRDCSNLCTITLMNSDTKPKPPLLPRILLTNARSLNNKAEELEIVLHSNKVDLAVVTETWFTEASESALSISDFMTFSKSRQERRGGGVAIFVKKHIVTCEPINHANQRCCYECLWLKFKIARNKPKRSSMNLYVGVIYYPPGSPYHNEIIEHVCHTVDDIRAVDISAIIMIMGDFNNLNCTPFVDDLGMTQLISFPTRGTSTLDKIFTNFPGLFMDPQRLSPLGNSDHCCILLPALCELPRVEGPTTRVRPIRDSSVRSFGQWMVTRNWDNLHDGLECDTASASVDNFLAVLNDAYHLHFPMVSSTRKYNDKPWITHRIKVLLKQRQRAYSCGNMSEWRFLRNKIQREIRLAKSLFYKNSIQHLKDSQPRKWHSQIQKLSNFKAKPTTIPGADIDPKATSEVINDHFARICNQLPALKPEALSAYLPAESPPPIIYTGQVLQALKKLNPFKAGHPSDLPIRLIREFADELASPLAHLFNSCLRDSVFPNVWKTATVVPIPKEKNITSLDKLRPISLTPIFARVFESFIAQWILADISSKLDPKQFGNVKGSSTSHYLVDMLDFIQKGLDKPGHYANLCTVDFAKAFDRVNHNIVIEKLIDLGVRRSIIPVVCSFLAERTQNTKLNGHLSSSQGISCGVPQGTKLGPILFLVLINDASAGSCRRWKYVDDLTLGEIVKHGEQTNMQNHLDDLSDWCKNNNVKPNSSKCHTMSISFLKRDTPLSLNTLDAVNLDCVTSMKLLGVTVQSNLRWDIHIKDIVSKASRRLYTLCILKKSNVPISDMIVIYTCYIRPIIEYACQVWHSSITEQQANSIESIQKRAIRIILGHQYSSYTSTLETLSIQSLKDRREDLVYKFGVKLLHSTRFRDFLPPYRESTSGRQLRSSTLSGLPMPKCRTERYKMSTIPYIIRILP